MCEGVPDTFLHASSGVFLCLLFGIGAVEGHGVDRIR